LITSLLSSNDYLGDTQFRFFDLNGFDFKNRFTNVSQMVEQTTLLTFNKF